MTGKKREFFSKRTVEIFGIDAGPVEYAGLPEVPSKMAVDGFSLLRWWLVEGPLSVASTGHRRLVVPGIVREAHRI